MNDITPQRCSQEEGGGVVISGVLLRQNTVIITMHHFDANAIAQKLKYTSSLKKNCFSAKTMMFSGRNAITISILFQH